MGLAATQSNPVDPAPEGELRRAWEGIDLCRSDRFEEGFAVLESVFFQKDLPESLPGGFFSYFGLGTAALRGRYRESVHYCKKGIELDVAEAEGYLCLARVHSYFGSRQLALAAIHAGLKACGKNEDLVALRKEMGTRRRPVIPFLSRDHRLNRVLGMWRHRWTLWRETQRSRR